MHKFSKIQGPAKYISEVGAPRNDPKPDTCTFPPWPLAPQSALVLLYASGARGVRAGITTDAAALS